MAIHNSGRRAINFPCDPIALNGPRRLKRRSSQLARSAGVCFGFSREPSNARTTRQTCNRPLREPSNPNAVTLGRQGGGKMTITRRHILRAIDPRLAREITALAAATLCVWLLFLLAP
jgi:hypothetical protein